MSERGRKVKVERKRQGIVPPQALKKRVCPECGGYGEVAEEYTPPSDNAILDSLNMPHNCELCHGTGKIEERWKVNEAIIKINTNDIVKCYDDLLEAVWWDLGLSELPLALRVVEIDGHKYQWREGHEWEGSDEDTE